MNLPLRGRSHFFLKKRDIIASVVQSTVERKTRKYGILVLTSFEEAYAFVNQDKYTCWRNVIEKEMKNVIIVFSLQNKSDNPPVGFLK